MTITTKAALADELAISRARVSQYVKAGLPVRPDGKLNRADALNWLKRNAVGLYSGADRGVNRAGRLAKVPTKRRKATHPAAKAPAVATNEPDGLDIIAELVARGGGIAAAAAIEAGAELRVAFALDHAVTVHLWRVAESMLGIPPGSVSPFETMVDQRIVEPDWSALADTAGEALDLDALDAFVGTLPSLQPPMRHQNEGA